MILIAFSINPREQASEQLQPFFTPAHRQQKHWRRQPQSRRLRCSSGSGMPPRSACGPRSDGQDNARAGRPGDGQLGLADAKALQEAEQRLRGARRLVLVDRVARLHCSTHRAQPQLSGTTAPTPLQACQPHQSSSRRLDGRTWGALEDPWVRAFIEGMWARLRQEHHLEAPLHLSDGQRPVQAIRARQQQHLNAQMIRLHVPSRQGCLSMRLVHRKEPHRGHPAHQSNP